jgi:hypothetical protein
LCSLQNLAGRAGFEPAHGVSNSHVPFQLGYRPKNNIRKKQKAPTFVGASEIESELGNLTNNQTNPEGRARLTRRLIMDLICIVIVIFEMQYIMLYLKSIIIDFPCQDSQELKSITCQLLGEDWGGLCR